MGSKRNIGESSNVNVGGNGESIINIIMKAKYLRGNENSRKSK